jgi:hypothetical protein
MSRVHTTLAVTIGIGALVVAVIAYFRAEDTSPEPAREDSAAVDPPSSQRGMVEAAERAREPARRSRPVLRRRAAATDESDPGDGSEEEAAIMSTLRELKSSNPPTSLGLARQGNARFPDSAHAPERGWYEARALVDLQRFDEARRVARNMVERYPGTHWTLDVQRHLLTHPFGLAPRYH